MNAEQTHTCTFAWFQKLLTSLSTETPHVLCCVLLLFSRWKLEQWECLHEKNNLCSQRRGFLFPIATKPLKQESESNARESWQDVAMCRQTQRLEPPDEKDHEWRHSKLTKRFLCWGPLSLYEPSPFLQGVGLATFQPWASKRHFRDAQRFVKYISGSWKSQSTGGWLSPEKVRESQGWERKPWGGTTGRPAKRPAGLSGAHIQEAVGASVMCMLPMSQKCKENECRSSKDVLQALAERQFSESVASSWVKGIARERGDQWGTHKNLQSPHEGTNLLSSLARPRQGLLFKHLPDPDNTKPLSQANYLSMPTSPTSNPEKEQNSRCMPGEGKRWPEKSRKQHTASLPHMPSSLNQVCRGEKS